MGSSFPGHEIRVSKKMVFQISRPIWPHRSWNERRKNGGIRSIFPLKNSLRSGKSQFISSRETLELVFKIPPRRSNS